MSLLWGWSDCTPRFRRHLRAPRTNAVANRMDSGHRVDELTAMRSCRLLAGDLFTLGDDRRSHLADAVKWKVFSTLQMTYDRAPALRFVNAGITSAANHSSCSSITD